MSLTIEKLNTTLVQNYHYKIIPVWDEFNDNDKFILSLCNKDGLQIDTKPCKYLRTAVDDLFNKLELQLETKNLEVYYFNELQEIANNCLGIL